MKIIDAHLHFSMWEHFDEIARAAGHENTAEGLRRDFAAEGIVHGVVMGNLPVEELHPGYPGYLHYCVGIAGDGVTEMTPARIEKLLPALERHLQSDRCVGVKLYPGYNYFYIYEDYLTPVYELAARYGKPVAVHTGLTATEKALLKYAHPNVIDEAATKFRDVNFVMCHFGEPYFTDAVAVMEKNLNVSADLSGMLEGKIPDFAEFCRRRRFYIDQLKGWLSYLSAYDRLMFGTDWPLANLGDYIAFTKELIPQEHWNAVFYDNAVRIYGLHLDES
ncbi:amidohydrolase family protein [Selenomonas artemidis]|jgi:hypothetical protein|uniref:Amidohydrolase family protein n=3 Tax=Selenomonas TaxID=970 RepID=E7N2W4_9FIRM|nr:amidohydrolase family protein [Selenomonas artemidis]EFW29525.1 amidohydrolase family protein [Selenomonas artemidis F0399]